MSRQLWCALLATLALALGSSARASDVVNITAAHPQVGNRVYATGNFALAPGRELVEVHIVVVFPPFPGGQETSIEATKVNSNGIICATLAVVPGTYTVRARIMTRDSRTGTLHQTTSSNSIDVDCRS